MSGGTGRNFTSAGRHKISGHKSRHRLRCSYHFAVAVWRTKEAESRRVKHWEVIADNLGKAGLSWGCSSENDSTGRVLFTADAYVSDGRRFTLLADDRLAAFAELHAAIHRQFEPE